MGLIRNAFDSWLREWATAGVPEDGKNEPSLAEGRAVGGVIEQVINQFLALMVLGQAKVYLTEAARNADYANRPADSFALVWKDPTPAKNDISIKGAAAWEPLGLTLTASAVAEIASLVSRATAAEAKLVEFEKRRSIRPLTITGTGDAIIGTSPAPLTPITSYELGQSFIFRATATNTTAAVTLAIDGLAAQSVLGPDGANPAVGDIVLNRIYTLVRRSSSTFTISAGVMGLDTPKTLAARMAAVEAAAAALVAGAPADRNTFAEISAALDAAVLALKGGASTAGDTLGELEARIASEVTTRGMNDAGLQASIATEAAARALNDVMSVGAPFRPGDSPFLFGTAAAGAPGTIPTINPAKIVTTDRGKVYRATGQETVALIPAFDVEPGEIDLVTFVVQRRVQEDPSGDGVRRGIRWMDGAFVAAGAAQVVTDASPSVAQGRVKVQALISTVPGADVGDIKRLTIPNGVVKWSPYVRTFGAAHQTDIEYVGRRNVTDLVSSGLDVTQILVALGALGSEVTNLAAGFATQDGRLDAVEGALDVARNLPDLTEMPSGDNLLMIRDRNGRSFSITLDGRLPSHDIGRGVIEELPSDTWRGLVVLDRRGRVIEGDRHDGTFYRAGGEAEGDSDELATRYLVETVGTAPNRHVVAVDPDGHAIRISPPDLDGYAPVAVDDGVIYAETVGGVTTRRKSVLDFEHPLAPSVNALLHIPVTGQSLSLGLTGPPREVEPTSANVPGRTVMFNGGIRTLGNSMNGTLLDTPLALELIENLVPMAEQLDIGGGETPWSRSARYVALAQGATKAVLPSCHGISGQVYANVKKGTVQWANMIRAVQRAKAMTQRLGIAYSVPALCLINGEADREDTLAVFQAKLEELVVDAQDMAAISGQADPVMLFLCQYSAWTDVAMATCEVPLAQLQASLDNPGQILCVGPKYHLEHSPDGTHLLSPRSDSIHGHYYGRAVSQTLAGNPWKPLYPVSVEWAGAEALIECHVPEGEITVDTTLVSDPGSYGLEYIQTGGSAPLIDTIAPGPSPTSIVVTMNGAPTGANPGFGFGITGISGNPGGPTTSPRTCFRDSSTELTEFGGPMFNWMCHSIVRAS